MPENKKPSCKAADNEHTLLPEDEIRNRKFGKNCQSNQNYALDEPTKTESDAIVSFTPEEVRYFLSLYYDVIVKESKPEVINFFYRSCQFMFGDDYDAMKFLPVETDNSRNKEINNNTPSKIVNSVKSSNSNCLDKSKSIATANNGELNEDLSADKKSANVRKSTLDDNKSVNKQYDCVDPEIEKDLKIKVFMAHQLWSQLEGFSDFLCDLLARKDGDAFIRHVSLLILDILFSTRGLHTKPDIANDPLPLGDTPLVRAVRSRDYDVILLLLRNGANVISGWMNFSCSLELLLFSPTQQAQLKDSNQMLRCLQLLLSAMKSISWKHLQQLEALGYYPMIPNWREVLLDGLEVAWGSRTGPPSLTHLCRCAVSTAAHNSGRGLQGCVSKLPLPNSLKSYLILHDVA